MNSTPYRAVSRTKSAARLTLAFALMSGMAAGATVATPAFAKDKQQQAPAEQNSKAFADAYAPMQKIINNPAGDFASAKAMIPTIQAAIQNDVDKNTFGNALVALGGKLQDVGLQKQGIQLSLASGKTPATEVGVFHYYLGKWAYADKNYAEARTQLQAAVQAGYTEGDPEAMIAETYFGQGQAAQGLQYLSDLIQKRVAAGQQVPDNWYKRGLKVAYDNKMAAQAENYGAMLVQHYPTAENWQGALQVLNAVGGLDENGQLDVFRLMRQTGALKDKHDYLVYASEADPAKLSNEVLALLDEGVKSGVLSASDPEVQKLKSTAESRAAANKAVADQIAADARKAATGRLGVVAGDQYLSLGEYDKAAEMYKLAAGKGGDDGSIAQVRLGIVQVKQGQPDAAKASFQQVTGPRAAVAKMWLAYLAGKSAPAAAATPPANGA